nr:uncharacterized protein LOC129267361 [Lytechinus pictus]
MAHGVSVTAMHQKDSNHEPLYVNSTMESNCRPNLVLVEIPFLSRSDVVPKQPIQDAFVHEYMEMKPMSNHTGVPPNHQASPPDNCALLHIVIYILGGSLGAMILGLVAVTVSYKCLQHNTDRAGDEDMADGVSVTAMHQKDSNHEPLYVNSTMSKPCVGGDPVVSRSDVVPKQTIQDSHEYMEMKAIAHTGVSPIIKPVHLVTFLL